MGFIIILILLIAFTIFIVLFAVAIFALAIHLWNEPTIPTSPEQRRMIGGLVIKKNDEQFNRYH
jgi:hypothetical protein